MARVERTSAYRPKNPLKEMFVEGLARAIVPMEIDGEEHLRTAREMLAEGEPVTLLPNHLTNADAVLLVSAMRRAGYDDLAGKANFVLGDRLGRNALISDVVSTISVVPPSEAPTENAMVEEKARFKKRMMATGRAVKEHAQDLLVMYAERSRSRSGHLEDILPSAANYVRGHAMAVGMWGQEKVLPIGSWLPRPGRVHVVFDKPISPTATLREMGRDPKREKEAIADMIGRRIAGVLPSRYRGRYNDYYEDLRNKS